MDRRLVRAALAAAVLVVALGAAVARPAPATAATPCWKTLLNDWYDGHIDHTYPLHCYQDALKHLPADVSTYSSAHDDILRALQNAKAKLRKEGKKITPNTPITPAGSSGGGGRTKTTKTTAGTTTDGSSGGTTTTSAPGRHPGGGLGGAAASSGSSASSVPVPLIVLGALALLLIAAGAAGLLAKRRQGRKPAP